MTKQHSHKTTSEKSEEKKTALAEQSSPTAPTDGKGAESAPKTSSEKNPGTPAAEQKRKLPLLDKLGKLGKKAESTQTDGAPKETKAQKSNPLLDVKDFAVRTSARLKKTKNPTTIAIDAENSAFHFYTMTGNDKSTIVHQIKNYTGALFDIDFFKRFRHAIKEFAADNPSDGIRKVSVVLPDCAVLTDAVKIPTLRGGGKTQKNLSVTLHGLYKNYDKLRVTSFAAMQNRQHTVYSVAALQKHIITSIYSACSENGMLVDTLTFSSSAAVGALSVLNPKQRTASYLFLDLKETSAHYAFVANGKVTGFYSLPFGLEFLRKEKLVQEDMLFDHSYAELSVLNAKERAKSKKLTVMSLEEGEELEDEEVFSEEPAAEDNAPVQEAETQEGDASGEASDKVTVLKETAPAPEVASARVSTPKLFVRRAARRLPKYMQRPTPSTKEGILYENFRIFVKWALTLIESNEKLCELGEPAFVCVNLPQDLAPVLEQVNIEQAENRLPFVALSYGEADREIASNLALFGGFYPKYIAAGKF